MADFNQTLAQMIAAAKPQFQVNQSHPPVVGGGAASPMAGKTSDIQVKAGVDIGAIMSQFGGTPEQKSTHAENAWQLYNLMNAQYKTPEERIQLDALTSNPDYQQNLKRWKAFHHAIIDTGKTNVKGEPVYSWIPGPPNLEKLKAGAFAQLPQATQQREVTREPSAVEGYGGAEGVIPGFSPNRFVEQRKYEAGPSPGEITTGRGLREGERERAISFHQQAAPPSGPSLLGGQFGLPARDLFISGEKEVRPKTADEYLMSEEGQTFIKRRRELEEAQEHVKQLTNAQISHLESQAALDKTKASLAPQEFEEQKRRGVAERALMAANMRRADAEAEAIKGDKKTTLMLDKEKQDAVQKLDTQHDRFIQHFSQNWSQADTEEYRFRALNELKGETMAYISGMKRITGNSKDGIRGFLTYLTHVEREFHRNRVEPGLFFSAAHDLQRKRREYYIDSAIDMLNLVAQNRGDVPDEYLVIYTNKIRNWGLEVGFTDQDLEDLFANRKEQVKKRRERYTGGSAPAATPQAPTGSLPEVPSPIAPTYTP